MFERFTDRARRVVVEAQEEARLVPHDHIGTEHLLLALSLIESGMVFDTFRFFELTHDAIRARVEEFAPGGVAPSGHIPFTPRAKKALELSLREALALGDRSIGPEHILLGIVREGTGIAVRVLEASGIDPAAVGDKVLELREARGEEDEEDSLRVEVRAASARGRGEGVALMGAWGGLPHRQAMRCSFCGRDEARCEHLLVAGGVRLCSDCARFAAAQVEALPADAPKLARFRRPEAAPTDKDAAVAAIEHAFDAIFGPMSLPAEDALWAVEGGDACLEHLMILREVGEQAPVAVSDITVERVRFLDVSEAEVSLGIWYAGNPQPVLLPAHAILEGGNWKVRRSTLEWFAQQAQQFRGR